MKPLLARNILPQWMCSALWGNRAKWGSVVNVQDPCWKEWQGTLLDFYKTNQCEGIGTQVNDAGYRVMNRIDLSGKTVLEIGAGDIRHVTYWRGYPAKYILADIQQTMLKKAEAKLAVAGVATRSLHMHRGESLPLADASIDVVVSFYSLEHIYPLSPYLQELKRILKAGGLFIGAIPAEGGLAWGGGRLVTSRRWFKKHTRIDPDKIICWEHPNFGDKVIRNLDEVFDRQLIDYWPLPWVPHLDFNLVIRYLYRKPI